MAKICTLPTSVGKMAKAANMTIEETIDGRVKIVDRASRTKVAVVSTEDEAREAIQNFVGQGMRDLDGGLAITGKGTPLSQSPSKPQDQLSRTRELVSLFQVGPGTAFFTPIEKFTQAVERLGKGAAFTQVYNPTQAAKRSMAVDLARTVRNSLDGLFGKKGLTYETALNSLDKQARNLSPEQRRLMVLHGEAFTREELARPGVLLAEGMSPQDISAAEALFDLGVADNIPLMLRRNALIDDFLENQTRFVEDIRRMENAVLEGRLPEELAEEIQRLKGALGTETSVDDVIKLMGLTDDERAGLEFIRGLVDQPEVTFNIPAIYRYATAPKAKGSFKTGADQFAKERGMLPEAVALSNARLRILDDAFEGTGFSREQVLGAQLPVFRQFITAGLMPGKQFARSSGAVKKWAGHLDLLPEGGEILTRRVLSGHINPHELNPAVSAYKHIRNLSMREHLDPIIEDVMVVAERIHRNDERAGRIVKNYIHEIQGLPTESFKQLTAMIRTAARFAGKKVDDRIAEKLVQTMTMLTYSASIPFRAALVARNYFQTSLAIPIIGPDAWWHGMKTALGVDGAGFSMQLQKEAVNRAIKAGAVKVNVVPLHGGSEVFTGVSEGLFGQMRSEYAKAGFQVKELFDAGFSLYRSGDDFGRVVAFEAGRKRVNTHLGKFVEDFRSGNIDDALETFKINAKVKTFDEVVEAEFDAMVRAGDYKGAENLIGSKLADKVHFLYGDANHPPGWGGVGGKLFGQFGTFPVQYANHVLESMTRGTVKDRAEFFFMHGSVNLGIIAAGAEIGLDLESWAFYPSLQYTGGPYAEILLSSVAAIGGSDAERALATRNLQMMFPWWNRPSIFVPGSYFVSDVVKGLREDDFGSAILRGSGARLLGDREVDFPGLSFVKSGFGWINEL